MPSLVGIVEKQIKYYTLFRVLRWEFASVYLVKPVLKVTCQSTVNQIPLILDQGSCGLIKSAMTHEKNLTLYETNTYAVKPLKTSNYYYTKEPYTYTLNVKTKENTCRKKVTD